MEAPLPNGINGRVASGRFAPGNPGGPGNPHGKRTAALRAMVTEAVTDDDLRAVVAKLVELAKGGDLAAIRELLDRTIGKPVAAVAVVADTTSVVVVEDDGWYGNDAHTRATIMRQAMLSEPEYLEYLRAKGEGSAYSLAPPPAPGGKGDEAESG